MAVETRTAQHHARVAHPPLPGAAAAGRRTEASCPFYPEHRSQRLREKMRLIIGYNRSRNDAVLRACVQERGGGMRLAPVSSPVQRGSMVVGGLVDVSARLQLSVIGRVSEWGFVTWLLEEAG